MLLDYYKNKLSTCSTAKEIRLVHVEGLTDLEIATSLILIRELRDIVNKAYDKILNTEER